MKRILAALVLCVLCFSAACLAEETPQTFEWDGMKARIVGLSENTALSSALDPPQGKYVALVIMLTEGEAEFNPLNEMLKEKFRLDEYVPSKTSSGRVRILFPSQVIYAEPGYLRLFFDVPADYDLTQGVLTYEGEPVAAAVDPADILAEEP